MSVAIAPQREKCSVNPNIQIRSFMLCYTIKPRPALSAGLRSVLIATRRRAGLWLFVSLWLLLGLCFFLDRLALTPDIGDASLRNPDLNVIGDFHAKLAIRSDPHNLPDNPA